MKDNSVEWLKAAEDDLILIENIIGKEYLTNLSAFHSQQAVEKSLKAILEYYDIDTPKIHSLNKLFELTKPYININIDYTIVIQLDSLYIDSRYPGDFGLLPDGKPSLKVAEEFYEFAKYIYREVRNKIEDIKTRKC